MGTGKEGLEIDFTTKILVDENEDFPDIIPQKIFNYKVFKHNKLVESKSNFLAMEHRIIILAMSQIKSSDENLKMYKIQIQDVLGKSLAKKTQVYNNYGTVRKAVQRLHKCTIGIEESDGWKSYAFVTKAQGKYRENFIEVQFHEDIQKFLLGLKSQYTTYTLDNVMKFKKNYSLRIYEFCKQYLSIGHRSMKLDYLRNLLSLEDKYPNFNDFKKNVIDSSIEEINKHSDIDVQWKGIRNGKSVDTVVFVIKQREDIKYKSKKLPEVLVRNKHMRKLESIGFSMDEISTMRKRYTEIKISNVLALFEKNIDEIIIPKAWILNALDENYVGSKAYQEELKKSEDDIALRKQKRKEVNQKKSEINDIQERISVFNQDILFYKETGKLRPGDMMRFPANYTAEQAIEELNEKKKIGELVIRTLEEEIEILEEEIDKII